MKKAAEYREIAAKFRQQARTAPLAQQRQLALTAAERWEALADDAELTVARGVALGGNQPSWIC